MYFNVCPKYPLLLPPAKTAALPFAAGRGPVPLQPFSTRSLADERLLLKVNPGVTSIPCLGDCPSRSDPAEEEGGHLRTGEKLMPGVWPLLNDEQRTLDTGFTKCHCSPLERLTFAPLAPSPRVPLALLAARGDEQTPQGLLVG